MARGIFGTLSAIAASLSTLMSDFVVQAFGHFAAFMLLAVIAAAATALLWLFQSETKPAKYEE